MRAVVNRGYLVQPVGLLNPATFASTIRRSNQLTQGMLQMRSLRRGRTRVHLPRKNQAITGGWEGRKGLPGRPLTSRRRPGPNQVLRWPAGGRALLFTAGAKNDDICRPSSLRRSASTLAISVKSLSILNRSCSPSSWCAISRPRKR